uniref:Uncharacterized protein n=1 Tax=Ixodes ricinus TaxID=34613 RepID=A0A6B0U4N8_IXORI
MGAASRRRTLLSACCFCREVAPQLNRLTSSFVYVDFCASNVHFVSEIFIVCFLHLLYVLTWNIRTDLQHFWFSSLLISSFSPQTFQSNRLLPRNQL